MHDVLRRDWWSISLYGSSGKYTYTSIAFSHKMIYTKMQIVTASFFYCRFCFSYRDKGNANKENTVNFIDFITVRFLHVVLVRSNNSSCMMIIWRKIMIITIELCTNRSCVWLLWFNLYTGTAIFVTDCFLWDIINQACPNGPWWRHQMENFSASLAICTGNSPVTGEFPAQRPVTRSFDVFFDIGQNKRLSKEWSGWWFETSSRPLWRHCNDCS